MFEDFIETLKSNGISCNKINPTILFDECDDKKIKIFENETLICIEN